MSPDDIPPMIPVEGNDGSDDEDGPSEVVEPLATSVSVSPQRPSSSPLMSQQSPTKVCDCVEL